MFRKMRRFKQEVSRQECGRVLQEAKRGVLSVLGDDGYPYGVPVNFYYDPENDAVYFHGAKEGHKIDAIKACSKVCFTAWDEGVQKDGDWAFYVTSVVIMGQAEHVEDPAEALRALTALTRKYYPTEEEAQHEIEKDGHRAYMIVLHPEHMTGKLVHEK